MKRPNYSIEGYEDLLLALNRDSQTNVFAAICGQD
jgi:hypothetical protein